MFVNARGRWLPTFKRMDDIMEKLGVAGIALGLFQGVSMGLWAGSLSCIVVLVLTFWWSKEAQKK